MVLYNMASFLASFATGFDIRISNLQHSQPINHPLLQNKIISNEYEMNAHNSPLYKDIYPHERDILNVGNPHLNKLYGLETSYHGQTKQKNRASLNQLAGFQNNRAANNFMQSTTLTTTSGLGSNFTSYTTDPIDDTSSMSSLISENKLHRLNMNANVGASSSFLESDLNTDEYILIPDGENPQFLSPQKICYGSDFYVSNSKSLQQQQQLHSNPFDNTPLMLINSGPQSFIELSNQYESDMFRQVNYMEQNIPQPTPPQLPPKTPNRTPVMGTKTIHRRTLSNTSSQSQFTNSNNNSRNIYTNSRIEEIDYRFHNFNINNAINREPLQFHSVPYSCNFSDQQQIPNRMRLYENVSHFQQNLQSMSLPPSHCQTPVRRFETSNSQEHYKPIISSSNSNTEKRKMFFATESMNDESSKTSNGNCDQIFITDANISIVNTSKVSSSTGCTPTHSTPQDSFSDDSSYLSALSRVRFSPDNFLNETVNSFSSTSRMAVANMQRAMVRRTIELEESDKS